MKEIIIIGASSDLAEGVIPIMVDQDCRMLLHCGKNIEKLRQYKDNSNVKIISQIIKDDSDCEELIGECRKWSSCLYGLIILMGGVFHPVDWNNLKPEDFVHDYMINTVYPVMIATELSECMKDKGGRIIFLSTASAIHGGGCNSLSYGMSKAAIECATKRMAKDLAQYNILVNAIAPGYMDTSLQVRSKGIPANDNIERLKTIPIGRAGTRQEFGGLVGYLLSDEASFITGQVITLDGGDFI